MMLSQTEMTLRKEMEERYRKKLLKKAVLSSDDNEEE